MSSARERYEKGKALEKQVALWLKRVFGFEVKSSEQVHGASVKRPHEVDVHAWKEIKRFLGLKRTYLDVWVECKATRVKRMHVMKLLEQARDVRDAYEEGKEEWYPHILMIVSSEGFDDDALRLADKYGIYCVLRKKGRYEFVGEMTREDFEEGIESEY